jgi:hypothetical protein
MSCNISKKFSRAFYFKKNIPHIFVQYSCKIQLLHNYTHGILQVFIIILYKNVLQNPAIFPTQVKSFSRAFYFSRFLN